MKRSLLVLPVLALVVACDESSAPATSDQNAATSVLETPATRAPEAEVLNAGVFMSMAEDHLKVGEDDYMKVYRLSKPAASTVNQPGQEGLLVSWKFTMDGESLQTLFVTLADFETVDQAKAVLDQVPSFSYLRTPVATSQQHRTARFGGQCVHLAANCELSADAFNAVWKELVNALDNPTLEGAHDQPCADHPV